MNGSLARRNAWVLLAASCGAYVLISLAHHQAFHPWGRLGYFDLKVYRGAGRLILNGRSLYQGAIWHWAPFTYPPLAGLLFTALAALPLGVDEVLVTVLGVVASFALVRLALRLPSAHAGEAAWTEHWRRVLIPAAAAGALWLEPITATLGYGQINLVIALLVVGDLSRPDAARGKGALIGLAAGLKLTPLIFVPYLLFSRRGRAALVAFGTFAVTVAIGYLLVPGDASRYWGGLFLDSSRVGGCCVPANQSLRGAILRLDPSMRPAWLLVIALVVGVAGVSLAIRASRRGDEAIGFSLCALTGLLVSPVSWTHHWTLVVPALLLVGVRVAHRRSKAGLIALTGTLLVGYSYLPKLLEKRVPPARAALPVGWTLGASSYVLIGLLALAVAGVHETRELSAARSRRRARAAGCARREMPLTLGRPGRNFSGVGWHSIR